MSDCPCSSGRTLDECCGPIHDGRPAPTAEALMRARYSAYAIGRVDFLRDSLVAADRDAFDDDGARAWSRNSTWLGLEIVKTDAGGPHDDHGTVDFIARWHGGDRDQEHHEIAEFVREDGRWFYQDGRVLGARTVVREGPRIGRNDPCPCGSGKKHKKCCGR